MGLMSSMVRVDMLFSFCFFYIGRETCGVLRMLLVVLVDFRFFCPIYRLLMDIG